MNRGGTRTLKSSLTRNLVGVGLASVALLAGINYFAARSLITGSVEHQLTSLRDARISAIESGFDQVEERISVLARDRGVVQALVDLSSAYDSLDQDITEDQVAGLESLYEEEALSRYDAAGADHPPAADLVPDSVAGRYIQQHYIADNPFPVAERGALDDAGDGSLYSAAHVTHAPFLNAVRETNGLSDLLLVSADTSEVVFSSMKRIDLGTDALDGPYRDDGLGEVVRGLSSEAAGDTVVADTVFYLPDTSSPVIFAAAEVRSGPEIVGSVVAQVPVEALTELTTARQDWDLLGLGETGETYVVGADRTLRSDSRQWLENPQRYLDRYLEQGYDPATADLIEFVGSPVLLQTVDNDAVDDAFDDQQFIGQVTSYLGDKTLVAAGGVDVAGLDWIVVAEQAEGEALAPLQTYLRRILVLLAVLLPVVAISGAALARALTRPVGPLVTAASDIAEGDLAPEIGDLGRNEFGDLAQQLEGVARQLSDEEAALVAEEQRIGEMLAAVLPPRLVDRVRSGEQRIADLAETATVVSLTIEGLPDPSGPDRETAGEMAGRIAGHVDKLMSEYGVERARTSSEQQLFLAGLSDAHARVDDAADFSADLIEAIRSDGESLGIDISVRAGLAAGKVATGVLGVNQVSFGVWGDPPGIALTLDSMARRGEVLADRSVVEDLSARWAATPMDDLVGLGGEGLVAYSLTRTAPAHERSPD